MSISNRHSILPFNSATSEPIMGQRLAVISFKGRNNKPAKFASVCASIPALAPKDVLAALETHSGLMGAVMERIIEQSQNDIIRALFIGSEGKLQSVSDEELGIAAIEAFLTAQGTGGRLTKVAIESWFDNCAVDIVAAILCEKLGIVIPNDGALSAEDSETIAPHLEGWKGVFSSLSGGATVLNAKQIGNLKIVLGMCEQEDSMAAKLSERLENMAKPKAAKMALMDLG